VNAPAFWPLAQADQDGWGKLIGLLIFIALPLFGRLLQALRKTRSREEGPVRPARKLRAPEIEASSERRVDEAEGAELWRRLLEGEEAQWKPEVVHVPPPARAPRAEERALPETSLEEELESQGEQAREPEPLATLGPPAARERPAEVSLEDRAPPVPLGVLASAGEPGQPGTAPVRHPALPLAREDLRRGVLLAEVLGPPLALRRPG
jgi:hypothetical protein